MFKTTADLAEDGSPKQGNIKNILTAFIIEIEFYSEKLEIWQTTKDRAK